MFTKQTKIIGLSSFIIAISFFCWSLLNKHTEEPVSAHPTSQITLAAGSSNAFTVPADATTLVEPALLTQSPLYDQFVQNIENIPVLEKEYVEAYGSNYANDRPISWSILDVLETEFGNYFVVFGGNGNVRGGVAKVSVYSKTGELLTTNAVGTLTDLNKRINTKVFAAGNNQFLIGTQDNTFYKYTVSGETATTATITRVEESATLTSTPNSVFGVGYYYKIDTFSDFSNESLVSGTVYFDSRTTYNAAQTVAFRVPIGTINVTNWQSNSFNLTTNYLYSLETLVPDNASLTAAANTAGSVNASDVYLDTAGHVYGEFRYASTAILNSRSIGNTVQIFDQTETTDGLTGKKVKKRQYCYQNSGGDIIILRELCTTSEIYFVTVEDTETKLIKVDLTTYTDEVLKTYPAQTLFNIVDNGDGTLSYYGATTKLRDEFYNSYYSSSLSSPYYFIQGIMTDTSGSSAFDVQSLRALPMTSTLTPEFIKFSNEKVLLFGQTYISNEFVDDEFTIGVNGALENTPLLDQNYTTAFIGRAAIKDDYSPIIKAKEDIEINLSDTELAAASENAYGWRVLDNWLITGTKNGTLSDAAAIQVFDHFDSQNLLIGTTQANRQKWLEMRINRNPNAPSVSIDWQTLGFDKTTAGPQLVSYFITDSQTLTTTSSRWINKYTDQTIEQDSNYLDAQNFHTPLGSVASDIPDEDTFKALAKTMAWDGVSHTVDEDGAASSFSSKVTVDAVQLKALQEAKTAKPYPVDVTYSLDDGTLLVNRVWVFVTTKNTVVDTDTGIVIYGDDYTLPLYLAADETMADVYTTGAVHVYDYDDNTHETDADCLLVNGFPALPPLADKELHSQLTIPNMSVITHADRAAVVQPLIRYTASDGTVTEGTIDVTITASVLFHVRQVIVTENTAIVLPAEGYLQVENTASTVMNVTVLSGKETGLAATEPPYKDVVATVDTANGNNQLLIRTIIPEYYAYVGYTVSTSELPLHSSAALTGTGQYQYDITNAPYEQWLTVYLTSTTEQPNEYSWDYKENELGSISIY